MNFLAHAYLSFGDAEVLTGNLISDYVKGKKKYDYPERILAGIDLHRAIDAFTDSHTITKQASRLFKSDYGLYSSAFIDVVYDHFLALKINNNGTDVLKEFAAGVYDKINAYHEIFPAAFKSLFPYMKEHDWLYSYQFLWGIKRSFQGLVHRAKYLTSDEAAMVIMKENYDVFEAAFNDFFPHLEEFSLKKFTDIH